MPGVIELLIVVLVGHVFVIPSEPLDVKDIPIGEEMMLLREALYKDSIPIEFRFVGADDPRLMKIMSALSDNDLDHLFLANSWSQSGT